MEQLAIYDHKNIDTLEWPNTKEGLAAKNFLLPMIKEGTQNYIENVETELKIVKVEDFIIPLTINNKEYNNSYVVSFYSLIGLLEEKMEKNKKWHAPLLRILLKGLGNVLKWLKINKTVIVNNWLFSTNLNPPLNSSHVQRITSFLQKNFPSHMIVFRFINTYSDQELLQALKEQSYQILETREVFFYDPKQHNVWSKRDCKRDWRMLLESNYTVIDKNEQLTLKDGLRGLQLYRSLYIDKYTHFSPKYTEKFIELLLKTDFLELRALKKNNELDGFAGYLKMYNTMSVPFFGYDTTKDAEIGLYRMLNILGLDEARKSNSILNQSSGADGFKRVRGLMPYKEYTAFGVKHLKGRRKLFWGSFNFFSNYILMPIIKRFNL